MKHRSPLVVVVLSIITLGIYDLYWLEVTRKVLNQHTTYKKIPSIWLLFAPVGVLILGYILLIISTAAAKNDGGHANAILVLIFILLLVIGWLSAITISIIWFFRYSKGVNSYTNGKMSTAVTFLILFLIHLIGVALVQDAFNDMEAVPVGSAPVGGAGAPPQPVAMSMPNAAPSSPMPTPPSAPSPPSSADPVVSPPADDSTDPNNGPGNPVQPPTA